MTSLSLKDLRNQAISSSLFSPLKLSDAFSRLSFVQADPIRSPASAQDLILRHRVISYAEKDLEYQYPSMDLEEGVLYAYGFMPRCIWHLLRPKVTTTMLSELETKVLSIVSESGAIHPKDLKLYFGSKRVRSGWGGYSPATKCALEGLHRRGLLRVIRREKGIRVFSISKPVTENMSPTDRFDKLIITIAKVFAPTPRKSLLARIAPLRRTILGRNTPRDEIDRLLANGKLESATVDSVTYIWPSSLPFAKEVQCSVRFLAPFDPLVWDRDRFEHLWGWKYRFEAYTPKRKRIRGYYAMPLLFNDSIIGWAQVDKTKLQLDVKLGFIEKRPRSRIFNSELDAEMARMEQFLNSKEDKMVKI